MDLVHTWFGMLVLPEGAMSTRKGNVIRLMDLVDEAVRRARAVVDEKSPDLSDEERQGVAEAVGTAAIRYADLSQNPQSNVTFTWDKMLSLDGNTAPYLMYSFARCRSIQRKGEVVASLEGCGVEGPFERTLALQLIRLGEVVASATAAHRPNSLRLSFRNGQCVQSFLQRRAWLKKRTRIANGVWFWSRHRHVFLNVI